MDRRSFMVGTAVGALMLGAKGLAFAQDAEGSAPPLNDFARNETVIVHNPEGVIRNPGWFNIWVNGGGGTSNGLHQLTMDTLWYIDPDGGVPGKSENAIYNALAAEPWQYNDDFTEMTVKLRQGILWSDGVEFTADDVVYTVTKQMETPGMQWSGAFSTQVAEVTAPDPYTVHFTLQAPNSRFHAIFSVRWNAAWIMPKHVFEKVDDVLTFDYNPPLSLGAYTLNSFDPNGTWYIWDKREDWDKTTLGLVGQPTPKHIIYRNNISTDNRLIEMRNGNLDMIHDLSPEGTFSIVKEDPNVHGWFTGFPYAHPDPTLPMAIFNHQKPMFQDKRVRWALALMLDARAMSMASYRGAATLSAISIPPTGTHPRDYHGPLQQFMIDYELDTGTSKVKPYDPTIGQQIADMVRPQFGEDVPTDPEAINKSFGFGWWKQNLQAAEELLTAAGFTKNGNQWMTDTGEPFAFSVQIPQEGVINRLGTIIAQLWSQAGVQASAEVAPDIWDRVGAGDYEVNIGWAVETWGGHPDLSFFLDSYHSEYVVEPGQIQPARNWMRWTNPKLDEIIEKIRGVDFNDPKGLEYGIEFVKLHLEEMPNIPIMSYNVFSVQSNKYWTGWPNIENNYANPVTNWSNGKYIFTQIEPTNA
ncbi:ABC transporter substrate-binding protein [Devosia rhodophyticola]|uniref:ABC transporter substrate-binding protein n=1 Tax=Devosia rhodophyticola TaxID=3026423 RepID=A0ABY7Z0F0_9HYPH|nr:ABC transporter substrate-binding protein [Devosia rhodophyticola]WDR06976.1 ABC transporter substrate-binding protein [Devosia rhodophyticola]